MRIHSALVALTVLSIAAGAVWAQSAGSWKWRDERGQVHVSDLPPPSSVPASAIIDRPAEAQRAAPPPAPKAAAATATAGSAPRVDAELEARRRRAVSDQVEQKKAQDEKDVGVRAENCSRAKGHLVALQNGQRMVRTNAQGEREALDDKGRADEMARARAVIASDCR